METSHTTIQTRTTEMPMIWTPWVNVAIGIAVIVTPFIGSAASNGLKISNVITGIIIGIVALIAFFASQSKSGTNIAVINIAAGIWLWISTSFALDVTITWENVVFGVLAILTAVISMSQHDQFLRLVDGRR